MDIKEYIESGVLEAYLSGELSDAEMIKVDHLADEYPLIKQELEAINLSVNKYMHASGHAVSSEVLNNVLHSIELENGDPVPESPEGEKPILTKTTERNISTASKTPFWAIAASVLLLISLGLNLFFYGKWEESRDEVLALTQERSLLTDQVETTGQQLDYAKLRIAHFLNEDNIHVRMEGEQISPESFANVFWNKNTNAVFISVDNLPAPPDGHQYQLWAIKDGQAPIDAGIFDHNQLVQELKVIKGNVLAFAVTLEKEGGTQIATVDKTFVKGFLENS